MPLEFAGDAICLSGPTGSKLKCEIIADYYPFWWSITSGGPRRNYQNKTAIIELNAATGEIFVEETKETILGSAGHALDLKIITPSTENLTVVLVENDSDCFNHLKAVIKRRWDSIPLDQTEGPVESNTSNIYLLKQDLDLALDTIDRIKLGNTLTLFYFDPLRMIEYDTIAKVAKRRIRNFKTGTEFIIFLFTSDWFLGRREFAPLPTIAEESSWNEEEKKTVAAGDNLFGENSWRKRILNNQPIPDREKLLIEEYKERLQSWFRYVLILPFNPKKEQIFHLIICSNYEVGIRMTKDAYAKKTGNPRYSPDIDTAFTNFKKHHPETLLGLIGRTRKPIEWKILWRIIRQHEDGICDPLCEDLRQIESSLSKIVKTLGWLSERKYLIAFPATEPWNSGVGKWRYRLNWAVVTSNLGILPPEELKPISPEQFRTASKLIEAISNENE